MAKKKASSSVKKPSSAKPARTHAAGSRSKTVGRKATAKKAKAPSRKIQPGKLVYGFGGGEAEGDASMADLLGVKGANLAEMTAIGLPVPPGFTITTEACDKYEQGGRRLPHGFMNEVNRQMASVGKQMGRVFGDASNPMPVSVRSGAALEMPGMMDTVLNLGLNDEAVEGLAAQTGDRRFAYDAYRRLIQSFAVVVMGVDAGRFEQAMGKIRAKHKAEHDADVPEAGMVKAVEAFHEVYRSSVADPFPQNPSKQLELAIEAVFKSWHSDRALVFRRINGITGLVGTAVNVQAMVFGNLGDDSGVGVAFTRNPTTGENKFHGEFLVNAQGTDLVGGVRDARPIAEMASWDKKRLASLQKIKDTLEKHAADMRSVDFTIERGELWILRTRAGKRTGAAALRIACDLVKDKVIDEERALLRVPADDLAQVLTPGFDPEAKKLASAVCRGVPASHGSAVGRLAFSATEAVERARNGEKVILVRERTTAEDVEGMHVAVGVLTTTGGMASHAAVLTRGWGTCCIAGVADAQINEKTGRLTVGGTVLGREDLVSLDGETGEVFAGSVATVEPTLPPDFAKVMRWADKHRTMAVRTEASSAEEARLGREYGAQGVGLLRTEPMFTAGDRIDATREMILAESTERREAALEKLLPLHRDDFIAVFEAAKGTPVTIRLLDPPLMEMFPRDADEQVAVARRLRAGPEEVRDRAESLHQTNPILGHRGCRLLITYPEILRMQVRAITEAAIECAKRKVRAAPEVLVPMVAHPGEMRVLREHCEQTVRDTRQELDFAGRIEVRLGACIETPRAAIVADALAGVCEFVVFGSNDLTQTAFGCSRDDAGFFFPAYAAAEILDADPFRVLDEQGVGRLIEDAADRARAANEAIKIGLCGAHGGDAASVRFCHRAGLDYVTCSPRQVPIARLAAAQAAIEAAG